MALSSNSHVLRLLTLLGLITALAGCTSGTAQTEPVTVGGEGRTCNEDPGCINRLHPAIPMVARAASEQAIIFHVRNASDTVLDPASTFEDPRVVEQPRSVVHPLAGPVYIEGAETGDRIAVTLTAIEPGPYGYTSLTPIGVLADQFPEAFRVLWRLSATEAVSDDLPGVRIPNAGFPGIVTVLPGPTEHAEMLAREAELAAAGGAVVLPDPLNATPADICGPGAPTSSECLRTFPPREHGGNMDIRYLGAGSTVYLPCFIDGCGLAVGDTHFAQGDGEASGTAIEMDATVTVSVQVLKDQRPLSRGPHYEGPSRLLDIPSERFYATTGFPLKNAGEVPPDMAYLESPQVAGLRNLSKDISLATRNALLEMIDHISQTYGFTREQAYIITSVAVDLRIGQLVDAPNVGVTAVLPLDIFEDAP